MQSPQTPRYPGIYFFPLTFFYNPLIWGIWGHYDNNLSLNICNFIYYGDTMTKMAFKCHYILKCGDATNLVILQEKLIPGGKDLRTLY